MKPHTLAILLALGLAAAGCQSGDLSQRQEKAEAKICSQLAAVGTALEQVAALKPTSTVAEAQAADKTLGQSLEALEISENQLEKLRIEAFQKQLRGFRAEVAKVTADKGMTLEQAATDLKGKAAPVIAARKALSGAVQCKDGAPMAAPPATTKAPKP
jgi:hypothetical protein